MTSLARYGSCARVTPDVGVTVRDAMAWTVQDAMTAWPGMPGCHGTAGASATGMRCLVSYECAPPAAVMPAGTVMMTVMRELRSR